MPFVGRSVRRFEDARLLRGRGRFTDDMHLPRETYAAFVRSPHAHALIRSIDTEAGRVADGVLAVLTAAEYAADGGRGVRHMPIPADALDVSRPAFAGLDVPQPPLAAEHVRFPGEAVAVVIAESAALARDAADLVEVDYEPLPAVADARSALTVSAPLLHADIPGNQAVDAELGDRQRVAAAFQTAAHVVELEVHAQRVVNCQLEPRSVVATYDQVDDVITMIAGSQGVIRQRAALAETLGIPPERVHVICPDVGGAFGPRTNLYPEQVVLAWAARRLGRPVRWTATRSEAFLCDFQGRDAVLRGRLGLDAEGHIVCLSVEVVLNVGAYTVSYVPLSNAARIVSSVYRVPCVLTTLTAALTNTVPTAPFRGAGRPETMYLMERLLDVAARRLGIDRLEVRRRNLVRREALPYTSASGLTYDSGDFAGNMDRAAQVAGWSTFRSRRTAAAERGRLAGIGLANYVEAPVGAPHERVQLTVRPEGVVEIVAGTQSSGQGHETTFAQVLADQLDIRPDQVRLVTGDTDGVRSGGGTHSDRSMRLAGSLIVEAAGRLREQCIELAAELLGAPPEMIHLAQGVCSDGQSRLSLFELATHAELTSEASFSGRIPAHPTGCAVCEVEIDPETGQVEITRYTTVDDVGQAVNPAIVHGQVHGGIAQGVGQALCEGTTYDPSGQLLSTTFLDYALLRAADLPELTTELAEDATHGNPLRIKGGGEGGITPAMPAVVNAIADALGQDALAMPLTPARLWTALP